MAAERNHLQRCMEQPSCAQGLVEAEAGSISLEAEVPEVLFDGMREFLRSHEEALDEDSKRRLDSNVLRVLDSKSPQTQALLAAAPKLSDYWDDASREHFHGLTQRLDHAGVSYVLNERLVRGLDYYNRTVFEWVTTDLGAQGTVLAGGRYDGLVEQLGGKPNAAVGFAMGMERIVLLLETLQQLPTVPSVDLYLLGGDDAAELLAPSVAEQVRDQAPWLTVQNHTGSQALKKKLQKADAKYAKKVLKAGSNKLPVKTKFIYK